MLNTLLRSISLGVVLFICLPAPGYAQQHPPPLLEALQHLERQSGKKWHVTWNDEGTSIKRIELAKQLKRSTKPNRKDWARLQRLAMDFLRQHHALFRIPADLADLGPLEVHDEDDGNYWISLQQTYDGLEVRLKEITLDVDRNAGVTAVNNRYLADLHIATTPRLSEQEALFIAQKALLRELASRLITTLPRPPGAMAKAMEAAKIQLMIETVYVEQPTLVYSVELGEFTYDIDTDSGRIVSGGRLIIEYI